MKLGEAKPQSRGDSVRLEELVDLVKFPNNKWVQLRILDGDMLSYKQHWINILTPKTKREVRIPKMCLGHNPLTEEMDGECPYCEVESQSSVSYLTNVIVRSIQDEEPGKIRVTKAEQASGFKDMASESWTPVRVLRLPSGLMKKVQELKALNKVKGKDGVKTFDVTHDKFGVDINIKYDENAKGPEKYAVNMAERTPMQEAEQDYLRWDLPESLLDQMGLDTLPAAKKELARMQIVGAEEFDGDDGDDDSLGKKKSSGKKPVAKKSSKFDDDEDDDMDDDEDDEDDAPPKRGAKKPAAKPSRKKPADDEDDDADDEDDEDDAPPPKRGAKKPAAKPAAKRKPADEDDEDDDFDDEDDEDEAPPKRGAKKPAAKRKPADEDDEDDEDDFDDEDEEEAPPKRGAKKPAAKPAAKKPAAKPSRKKPADEDDEDEDDDGDDDEDDDEPF